jgi:hypothetical protein
MQRRAYGGWETGGKRERPEAVHLLPREETAAHAGRLYDVIAALFGERTVFMAIELEPGVDFVDRITEVVGACHVFLVVVGPMWATLSDGGNRPRITDRGLRSARDWDCPAPSGRPGDPVGRRRSSNAALRGAARGTMCTYPA